MRHSSSIAIVFCLLAGCGQPNLGSPKPSTGSQADTVTAKGDNAGAHTRTYGFGEVIQSGDLRITVSGGGSARCAGRKRSSFSTMEMMLIKVSIKITSKSKIADWP